MPQDPFSTMAVKLLESNTSNPTIDHILAMETFICDLQQPTLKVKVYLNYRGQVRLYATRTFTYNTSETEHFTWDDESKSGMSKACHLINTEIS